MSRIIVAIAVALGLCACHPVAEGRPCRTDTDCPRGDSCVDSRCSYTGREHAPGTPTDSGPLPFPDAGDTPDDDGGEPPNDAGPLPGDAGEPDEEPWWDDGFAHRRALRVHNLRNPEALEDFPLPVFVDSELIDLAAVQAGGQDLRFVADDGVTVLAHEIERFDPEGTSLVWVRVPRVAPRSASSFVWLYYGNPAVDDGQDPAGVWSADFVGVLHMEDLHESVSGASLGGDTTAAGGVLGGSRSFAGAGLELPLDPADFNPDEGSVSLWMRPDDAAQVASLFGDPAAGQSIAVIMPGDGDVEAGAYSAGAALGVGARSVSSNSWRYVGVSWSSGTVSVFIEGSRYDENLPADFAAVDQVLTLGNNYAGRLDEVRLERVSRSRRWMQASYDAGRGRLIVADAQPPPPPAGPRASDRVPGAALLWDFGEGEGDVVADEGALGKDLVVSDGAVEWLPGGVWLREPGLLTAGEAPELLETCSGGALTVEAWVAPDNRLQGGPARIFTFSTDTAARNFTLGQEGGAFNLRLRTSSSDSNGSNNGDLSAPSTPADSVRPGEVQHVVFSRDEEGLVRGYLDAVEVTSRAWPGQLTESWSEAHALGVGDEINGGSDGRSWLGGLYLVALYCRDLSPDEIAQNFQAGP